MKESLSFVLKVLEVYIILVNTVELLNVYDIPHTSCQKCLTQNDTEFDFQQINGWSFIVGLVGSTGALWEVLGKNNIAMGGFDQK